MTNLGNDDIGIQRIKDLAEEEKHRLKQRVVVTMWLLVYIYMCFYLKKKHLHEN